MWRQTRWRLRFATAFRCPRGTRWSSPGMHLIPRYSGDVPDPRGGVRHVMPGKGNDLAAGFEAAGCRANPVVTVGYSDPIVLHVRAVFDTSTDIAILALLSTTLESRSPSRFSWPPTGAGRGFA